jgi:hypothetical protein
VKSAASSPGSGRAPVQKSAEPKRMPAWAGPLLLMMTESSAGRNTRFGSPNVDSHCHLLLTLFTYGIYFKYAAEENERYGLGVFPLRA